MRKYLRLLLAAAVLLVPATVLLPAAPAGAATNGLLNAGGAPAWQTNGAVDAIQYADGMVFIGGDFTSVRPPGAPAGTDEVPRHQIAAFDAQTGDLLPFNPDFEPYSSNWGVLIQSFAVSADGHRLYVGGNFYTIDGVKQPNITAFDLPAMTRSSWKPPAPNGQVLGITVAADGTVYFGGRFTAVGGTPRANAAAYSPDAQLSPWAPQTDDAVRTLQVSPDGSEVVIGGSFSTVDGVRHRGLMAVDPAIGANMAAWGDGPQMSQYFEVYSTAADATSLYFGGVDNGGRYGVPEFDGTAALDWTTGTIKWSDYCKGDTIAVSLVGGVLYSGSHVHDCSLVPGAFGDLVAMNLGYHHMLAESATDGTVLPWFPNTDAGSSEGDLGPKTMATDGSQIWYGGTFTELNHQPQASFARFAPGADTTVPSKPDVPTAALAGSDSVQVQWPGSVDLDDGTLTYNVYRDNGSTPVRTLQVDSRPWSSATVSFTDKSVPSGTHTYTVVASDGTNVSYRSDASNAVTVGSAAAPGYAETVEQAGPSSYWRLGEPTGSRTAADASGRGVTATYSTGVSYGTAGAIAGDSNTAVTLDGRSGSLYSTSQVTNPQRFSLEMWFSTQSRTGGKLIGFGNNQTTTSSKYDRQVYLTSGGRLVFGVYANGAKVITSSKAYNDGKWHQVVATLGSGGMALYVDGALVGTNATSSAQVYNGYWHLSGDKLGTAWPGAPTSSYLAGSIDDVAIYPYALDGSTVAAHFHVAGSPPPPPTLAAYPATVIGDHPTLYWRFGEPSGSVANDASGNAHRGVYRSGLTLGAAGALSDGDTAVFSPGDRGVAYSADAFPAPSTYSIEVWLKTTETRGGKIFGFENVQSGWGNAFDRQIYLTQSGQLAFGVSAASGKQVIETTGSYNDGAWHDIVATQGSAGMALYVDGQLVGTNPTTDAGSYTGYWRAGGGNLTGWPDGSSHSAVAGTFDEAAVYPVALTAAQAAAHYSAAAH